jgi:hypothetical protein
MGTFYSLFENGFSDFKIKSKCIHKLYNKECNNFFYKQNEKFDTIEGPIQPKYQYSVPKEFGDERFNCDFNKKWYLPAAGIPAFELDIYRGKF